MEAGTAKKRSTVVIAAVAVLAIAALAPAALHLGWQVATLRADDSAGALARFRANRFTGLLIFLACVVVGTSL